MKLIQLEQSEASYYIEYLKAFNEAMEVPFTRALTGLTYEAWLEESARLEDPAMLPEGYVPSHVFFLSSDSGELLGHISVRTRLNEALAQYGGHVGYIVSPVHRGRGFGGHLLQLGLEEARRLGLKEVLITCDQDNLASRKMIESRGGRLVSEDQIEGVDILRYIIDL